MYILQNFAIVTIKALYPLSIVIAPHFEIKAEKNEDMLYCKRWKYPHAKMGELLRSERGCSAYNFPRNL